MCTEIFLARLTGPVICGVTTPRIRWITRNSVSRSRVPLQNLHARVTKLPRARNQECALIYVDYSILNVFAIYFLLVN